MKAKLVSDNLFEFTRGKDPLVSLGIGIGPKYKRKSFKILQFIKSKGEEGASFTEIQHYIYVVLNGGTEEDFWEKGKPHFHNNKIDRRTRGYWAANLVGTGNYKRPHIGLLPNYCHKNEKGKWVFDRYPKSGENIY